MFPIKQYLTTFTLTDLQVELLDRYLQLLSKWNTAYNLTAITDPDEMVIKHLADSLVLCDYLKEGTVLDIGSGAGLPGIPLAIALPDVQFTLLDSSQKRCDFLSQIIYDLKLKNVKVVNSRAEKFQSDIPFDYVTARAVAPVLELVKMSEHNLKADGLFLFLKGKNPSSECEDIKCEYEIIPLVVPHLNENRNLVKVKRSTF